MMSLIVVVLAIGISGEGCTDKTTEAACGAGCVWKNNSACSGSPGSCSGTAACGNAGEAICNSNDGCYWQLASPSRCVGQTNCSAQITQAGCDLISGCAWSAADADSCTGAPTTCSGDSADKCKLSTCKWTPNRIPESCGAGGYGNAVHCGNIITKSSCSAVSYCEWSGPEPAGCFLGTEITSCSDANEYNDGFGPLYCAATPGCTYSGSSGTCSGSITTPIACSYEDKKLKPMACYLFGCTISYEDGYECSGTSNITSCSQVKDMAVCEQLGCTVAEPASGTCSGTADLNAGAGATDEKSCQDLGVFYYWDDGTSGFCDQKDSENKQCSEFTGSGKEICYGLGCAWTPAVEAGCAPDTGTTTNVDDCASLTSDGRTACEGNQCTWVAQNELACKGSSNVACSDQSVGNCGTVGGCTLVPAVSTATCTGTSAEMCIGDTSTSCTGVNGCSWSPPCVWQTTQSACVTNGCTWTTATGGSCTGDSDGASIIYFPVLLGLLLLTFLL